MAAKDCRHDDFFAAIEARATDIRAEYLRLTPRSATLATRAATVLPGGFTRDAVVRQPYAPYITNGAGTRLTDADGREIVDMWFNATSLPIGHAHPSVVEAASRQIARGSAFFAPTEHELALADILIERLPCADRVRFTNSGSEAVMLAVRLARAATIRSMIVKFEGSYHGSYDDVNVSVGPPAHLAGSPMPVPDSAGLCDASGRVAVLPFNDTGALESFLQSRGAETAAVLIEPVANRMGLILPDPDFLIAARRLCSRFGIVLVFDEVIAFRIGYNGAQGELGVTPDLVCLGKVIGGGFPVGAVAGRADILDLSEPERSGRVTHAGTFNGNPVVGVAGSATLSELTPEMIDRMNALGVRLRARLSELVQGLPLQVTGAGSLFKVTATAMPVRDYRGAASARKDWERLVSLALYNEGFLLTPGLAGCVSALTTDAEVDALLGQFEGLFSI